MKKIEITQTNYTQSLSQLCVQLNKIISENVNNINNIVSNGNICSVLQDDLLYTLKDKLKKDERYYSIGEYNNIELFVDTLQLWTDNRIILKNHDIVIEEIEIIDDESMLI
jgi:hypothetical protein